MRGGGANNVKNRKSFGAEFNGDTTCICGEDMRLEKVEAHPIADDSETRHFACECGHVMRLMVWTKCGTE
jgi:hypothetical protein